MVCMKSFCGPLRNHCYVAGRETPLPLSGSSAEETKSSSPVGNRTEQASLKSIELCRLDEGFWVLSSYLLDSALGYTASCPQFQVGVHWGSFAGRASNLPQNSSL